MTSHTLLPITNPVEVGYSKQIQTIW